MSTCAITGTITKPGGTTPVSGVRVYALRTIIAGLTSVKKELLATSNDSGVVTFSLPRTAHVYLQGKFECNGTRFDGATGTLVEIPNTATANLADIVPTTELPSTGATVGALNTEIANRIQGDADTLAAVEAMITISSPLDLPGDPPAIWLDASDLSSLGNPNDGDPVTTWLDKSGNGNHATAAGDFSPVFVAGASSQYGLPYVNLRPSGYIDGYAYFTLPLDLLANAEAVTLLSVMTGSADSILFTAQWTVGLLTSGVQWQIGAKHDWLPAWAYIARDGNGIAWPVDDGLGGIIPPIPPTNADYFNLGTDGGTGTGQYIAEFLLWPRLLTVRERRLVMEYLSEKWER